MKKIIIVGGNARQTKAIHNTLSKQFSADIKEIHFKSSEKHSTKNPTNLGFIYHLSVIHFLSQRAKKSFTCFFFLFIRKYRRYTLMYRLLGKLCNNVSFRMAIGSVLKLYHKSRIRWEREKIDANIIIFTGLMSTKIEMQMYWIACKNNISTVYWPYNWDNCYGKHHSLIEFDHTFCWSAHMKNYCENDKIYGATHILPHPRLSYVREIRSNQKVVRSKILVALSQKPSSRLIELITQLSEIQILTGKQVILRPHPDNVLDDQLVKLIAERGLTLDLAYSEFAEGMSSGIPAREQKFLLTAQQTLCDALTDAVCVISEGGTLCLEARAIGIPVAVLANNPWQITARHFLQVDHFQPLCSKSGVHVILHTNEWAFDFSKWLSNIDAELEGINTLLDPIIFNSDRYNAAASHVLKLAGQNRFEKC